PPPVRQAQGRLSRKMREKSGAPVCALILRMRSIHLRYLPFALLLLAFALTVNAQQPAPLEAPSATQPPAATPAEFMQARKLMQQGKADEAIAQLETIEARDPATKGLALELGTAYYKKNDFAKAMGYLKKATEADPANGEATQLLGLAYYRGGHPADAIPLL